MITTEKIKSIILMLVLLTGGWASAALLDDFENYEAGQVDAVTTIWNGDTNATITADPVDSANQVIRLAEGAGSGQQAVYGILNSNTEVPNGTTRTIFLRFRATASIDSSFGLTDIDVPSTGSSGSWGDFYPQVSLNGGYIRVRASAVVQLAAINTNWYNLWMIVDNQNETVKFYMHQRSGENAVETDVLANGTTTTFNFRDNKTTTNALDRFYWRAQNNTGERYVWIDDINVMVGTDLSYPMGTDVAHNPTPSNGATGVAVDATLSWYTRVDPEDSENPDPNVTKHYVYMRQGDPNLKYITPYVVDAGDPVGETASCSAAAALGTALALDKTYYWRVDESIDDSGPADSNTITGIVWSFETKKSVPEITQQPATVRAFATDPNAVFTCQFTSVEQEDVTVTWYKHTDDANELLVDGVNDVSITTGHDGELFTSVLQIDTPEDDDQGEYFCRANNGTIEDSDMAALIINRMLAQYDFNNDLAPNTTTSKSDAPTGQGKSVAGLTEPNSLLAQNVTLGFETGCDGTENGAVKLVDPNQYIDFGTTGYPRAGSVLIGLGDGLDVCTILCWVKPNEKTHSLSVLNNYNMDITTGIGFSVETNMDIRINVRGEPAEILTINGQSTRPEYDIYDGDWHMIGVRWNAVTQDSAVFVDGQWVVEDASMGTPTDYAAWERGVMVGAGRQGSPNRHLLTNFFSGAIDNLRIYNYEVTAEDIADEYYTAKGVRPCTNMTFDGSDYDFEDAGDSYCIVDLGDFMVFMSEWMDCGLYPDCP